MNRVDETPRTEAMLTTGPIWQDGIGYIHNAVPVDFARTLERELNALRAGLTELAEKCERYDEQNLVEDIATELRRLINEKAK